MAVDLIFEDPPTVKAGVLGGSELGVWLEALRKHPGKWAKFHETVSSAAVTSLITKGNRYGVHEGEFQARTAGIEGTHRRTLYARYVGGES